MTDVSQFLEKKQKSRQTRTRQRAVHTRLQMRRVRGREVGAIFGDFRFAIPYRFLTLFLAMFFIFLFLFPSFLCPCCTKWLPAFCFECVFFLSFLDCWVGGFFFFLVFSPFSPFFKPSLVCAVTILIFIFSTFKKL